MRKLERSSRSRGSPESIADWRWQRSAYHALLRQKRQHFWRAKIDTEKSSLRQLWRSVDALLGRGRVPPVDAISAEQFHRFFDDKVASVRSSTAGAPPPLFQSTSVVASFQYFKPVIMVMITGYHGYVIMVHASYNMVAVVRVLPDKRCNASDPLLTNPLKAVVDIIAPFLTNLLFSGKWACTRSF